MEDGPRALQQKTAHADRVWNDRIADDAKGQRRGTQSEDIDRLHGGAAILVWSANRVATEKIESAAASVESCAPWRRRRVAAAPAPRQFAVPR